MLRLFAFNTDKDGDVSDHEELTDIVADFNVDETAGDERFIKASDLQLSHFSPIPRMAIPGVTTSYWVALKTGTTFYADTYNVYAVPADGYDEYDHKTGIYTTRLRSVQSILFQKMADKLIRSETVESGDWNYGLSSAIASIIDLKYMLASGYSTELSNRAGFSVGDMLKNLENKHDDTGFTITSINLVGINRFTSHDVPLIFRGDSDSVILKTAAELIDATFYQHPVDDTLYEIKWKSIFELAAFMLNAFIYAIPRVGDSFPSTDLELDIYIQPKINFSASSWSSPGWSERKYHRDKYRLDGVTLRGKNFEFVQGLDSGGARVERDLFASDPTVAVDSGDAENHFYFVVSDYNNATQSGYPEYNIQDGSSEVRAYFSSGLVEDYYVDMIGDGKGYSGKVDFNGQRPLDILETTPGGDVIQINRVQFGVDEIVTVEGPVVTRSL